MRRLRRARESISAGRATARTGAAGRASTSPDLALSATLEYASDEDDEEDCERVFLCVAPLLGGARLQRIPLEEFVRKPYCPSSHLLWAPTSPVIVVRFGDEWDSFPDKVFVEEYGGSGMIFVDLTTGSLSSVYFPSQKGLLDCRQGICSDWSSDSHLLIRHADEEDETTLSVYSSEGSLAASIGVYELEEGGDNEQHFGWEERAAGQASWAPSAEVVAFHLPTQACVMLWEPFSGADPERLDLEQQSGSGPVVEVVWSPCSSQLLVQRSRGPAAICSLEGDLTVLHAVSVQHHWVTWGPVSGIVSLCAPLKQAGRKVHVGYRRLAWRQGQQVREHASPSSTRDRVYDLQQPARAPDGTHYAAVSWRVVQHSSELWVLDQPCVEILSYLGGSLMRQPVACWRPSYKGEHPDSCQISTAWSPDGCSLLVTSDKQHMLLTFE